jgi:uncharacterized protein (DUF169 family)
MTTIKEFNQYGEDLERLMLLRTSPIAVKMLEKETDIPEGAIRPKRDRGQHIAQCQAFALSRRQRETIAMLKEDNWCFAPLIAYGLVDKPDDPRIEPFTNFVRFERDKYIGIVSAPLRTANFEPDVVLIYSNTAQMRNLLMPLSFEHKDDVEYFFFPPACAYQIVPVMSENKYMVTLPDPGDYTRALAGEDEIILSVPKDRMEELMNGLNQFQGGEFSYISASMFMLPDFPRPEFYQQLFKKWGLDSELNAEK